MKFGFVTVLAELLEAIAFPDVLCFGPFPPVLFDTLATDFTGSDSVFFGFLISGSSKLSCILCFSASILARYLVGYRIGSGEGDKNNSPITSSSQMIWHLTCLSPELLVANSLLHTLHLNETKM